jgi:putative ABC transport system substrate-binding protein
VFTLVASPTLAKIVPDKESALKRNVTGVVHVAPVDAQIKAIAAYRPFDTLGVLYTPTEQNSVVVLGEIRKLGRTIGFDTVSRTFRLDGNRRVTADGAADLVRELKDAKAQWLYLPPDSFLGTLAQDVIIPTAMEIGLPTFASTEQLMQAGALSGLVSRYYSVGQFTAHKAEQILVENLAPAAIPIEPLKRFSYQIRMSAAEKLHLPPPLPMLGYAELVSDASVAPVASYRRRIRSERARLPPRGGPRNPAAASHSSGPLPVVFSLPVSRGNGEPAVGAMSPVFT